MSFKLVVKGASKHNFEEILNEAFSIILPNFMILYAENSVQLTTLLKVLFLHF